jgi:hypothetical protein
MDKKPERNFFPGPFNPKYKDLNLFDPELVIHPIRNFIDLKCERVIERQKQLKIIEKYKKDKYKKIKFYL